MNVGFDVKAAAELSNYGDARERAQYFSKDYFNPGYDCNDILLGFKITRIAEDANEAKVKVFYEIVGFLWY